MHVGILKISLQLPDSHNLKEKRQIIRSLSTRIRNRFNVSIAEVGNRDLWQMVHFGIAYVNTDTVHIQQTFSKILNLVIEFSGNYQLLDQKQEIMVGV